MVFWFCFRRSTKADVLDIWILDPLNGKFMLYAIVLSSRAGGPSLKQNTSLANKFGGKKNVCCI